MPEALTSDDPSTCGREGGQGHWGGHGAVATQCGQGRDTAPYTRESSSLGGREELCLPLPAPRDRAPSLALGSRLVLYARAPGPASGICDHTTTSFSSVSLPAVGTPTWMTLSPSRQQGGIDRFWGEDVDAFGGLCSDHRREAPGSTLPIPWAEVPGAGLQAERAEHATHGPLLASRPSSRAPADPGPGGTVPSRVWFALRTAWGLVGSDAPASVAGVRDAEQALVRRRPEGTQNGWR